MRRARTDLAAGALLSLVGVGACLGAARLTVGSALEPQPGFFPFVGGILLITLSVCQIGHALFGRRAAPEAREERLGPPAWVVAGLVLYVWLLPWSGYPLTTAILTLLVLRVQDTRWASATAVSVILSLGSYALFTHLGVPLPVGRLFGE